MSNARFKAHPKQTLADGTKAVGVTTVLGVLNKPALVRWANLMGLKGIDTTKYTDEKAKVGTLAHAMVLADLAGIHPDWKEYEPYVIDQAENCFIKWLEWRKRHEIEPILVEKGLVSELYRYGGILDGYCKIDGVLTLLDLKTGKGIYDEYWYQVAAYGQMVKELGHAVDEYRILNIGRDETESFKEEYRKDVGLHFQVFLRSLDIYNLKNQLKGA